jgi:putative endonuclease
LSSKKSLGKQGEAKALAALLERGYTLLVQNWHCELGEIDIAALHNGELVIVEVRTRRGKEASAIALESISPNKQARLTRLAEAYRAATDQEELPLRIDVVIVAVTRQGTFVEIYENAVGW